MTRNTATLRNDCHTAGSCSTVDVVVEPDEFAFDGGTGCGEEVILEGHPDDEHDRIGEDDQPGRRCTAPRHEERRARISPSSRRRRRLLPPARSLSCPPAGGPRPSQCPSELAEVRTGDGHLSLPPPARRRSSTAVSERKAVDVAPHRSDRLQIAVAEGLPDLDRVRPRWAPRRCARPGHRTACRPGWPRSTRDRSLVRSWRKGICPVSSSQIAVLLLARRELQHLPGRALVLARGVEPDVLGITERVGLLRRCA